MHGGNDGYGGERGSTGCEIQQTNTKSREGAADMRAHWHMHSHIPALKHTCTRTHENVRARERAGTQLLQSSESLTFSTALSADLHKLTSP